MSSYIIPNIYKHQMPYLKGQSYKPGAKLISYLTQKLKSSVTPEFKTSCTKMDELRDHIINQYGLAESNRHCYADYVIYLTSLTENIDMSEKGVCFEFSYGSEVNNDINYDICLLGFNIVLGLLKHVSGIEFGNREAMSDIGNSLSTAKAIFNKVKEMYRDDYLPLNREQILIIGKLIEACWTHSAVYMSIFKNASSKISAQTAKLCYTQYSQLNFQPPSDLPKYFHVFSYLKMFEHCINEKMYGDAIAYGKYITANFLTNKKHLPEILLPLLIYNNFEANLKNVEKDNHKIYYLPVPASIEVPSMAPLSFAGKYDWNGEVGNSVVSLQASSLNDIKNTVNTKILSIQDDINCKANDLLSGTKIYPKKGLDVLDARYKELEKLMDTTKELIELVSGLTSINRSGVLKKMNDITEKIKSFNTRNDIYKKSANISRSKNEAAVKSVKNLKTLCDTLEQKRQILISEFDKTGNILDNAELLNAPIEELKQSEIIRLKGLIEVQINEIEKNAIKVHSEGMEIVNELKMIWGQCSESFDTEMRLIKSGFDNCICNYRDLMNDLSETQQKLSV